MLNIIKAYRTWQQNRQYAKADEEAFAADLELHEQALKYRKIASLYDDPHLSTDEYVNEIAKLRTLDLKPEVILEFLNA